MARKKSTAGGTTALSVHEIEDRLEEAARTLRRLPNPPGSGPKGYGSSWPDYVRSRFTAYGADAARMKVVPSARDIAEMEECLEWLGWLSPDDAKIVWLRAEGMRWAQVGRHVGVVRQTAWRRWAAALITIARHLERAQRPGGGKKSDRDGGQRALGLDAARDASGETGKG